MPIRAPPAFADRNTLWNAVEKSETQWNSQLARRFEIALPKEIPSDQYPDLVRAYCNKYFVSKGMCVDFAIHDVDSQHLLKLGETEKELKVKVNETDQIDLTDLLLKYLDLRKNERQTWSIYGQRKAAAEDLKKVSSSINHLNDLGLHTVADLEKHVQTMADQTAALKTSIKEKAKRIKEINLIIAAHADYQETKSFYDKYTSIRFKKAKEKYKTEHPEVKNFFSLGACWKNFFSMKNSIKQNFLHSDQTWKKPLQLSRNL